MQVEYPLYGQGGFPEEAIRDMKGPGRTITIVSTAILAYCSIVGLILTGHSGLRAEMQSEHADIRSEMRAAHTSLRAEHTSLRAEHTSLRTEIANLRSEMNIVLESIRADLRQIRDHLYNIGNAGQPEPAE